MTTMLLRGGARVRLYCSYVACVVVACVTAASADENKSETAPASPAVIFSAPLPDAPGKQLVVVALHFPPTTKPSRVDHRHPGSVYVYVTQGVVRLAIEGQPAREVKAGESFFEPAGALHTVAESASPTESASAIAVMIVPDGAPLVTVDQLALEESF